MKILIIGNGGREHAIGIKILKDQPSAELFFAKGNGGTASIGTNINSQSVEELASFAKENRRSEAIPFRGGRSGRRHDALILKPF